VCARAPTRKQIKDIMLVHNKQGIKTYERDFIFIPCDWLHTTLGSRKEASEGA
jgi:hypothetical protein